MSVLTGTDGQLNYNGRIVAKCRSWTLNMARDAIEITHLGTYDREYTVGLRGVTGTTSLYYDSSDRGTAEFLASIHHEGASAATKQLQFQFNKNGGEQWTVTGFVTSIGATASVGDASTCDVAFQGSGAPSGDW